MTEPEKIDFLSSISCYVLLNDEPANCKERVENLRCNESESSIPLAYYEGIDDVHFHLFVKCLMHKEIAPILVVNWGEYDNEKTLWDSLAKIMTGEKFTPRVFVVDGAEEEDDGIQRIVSQLNYLETLVYRSASDMNKFYSKLKNKKDDLAFVVKHKKIYIPEDIMIVSPDEKGVVENDYGVVFHENAYKRVVLWHLSKGHDVYFYPSS